MANADSQSLTASQQRQFSMTAGAWAVFHKAASILTVAVITLGRRKGIRKEWHSVKPNTLGLKVLRTKTPARRPIINNMISISLYGKPCVSDAYSILFIYNSLTLILVRVERKSLIRKTLILIRVPFVAVTFSPPALGGTWQILFIIRHPRPCMRSASGIRLRSRRVMLQDTLLTFRRSFRSGRQGISPSQNTAGLSSTRGERHAKPRAVDLVLCGRRKVRRGTVRHHEPCFGGSVGGCFRDVRAGHGAGDHRLPHPPQNGRDNPCAGGRGRIHRRWQKVSALGRLDGLHSPRHPPRVHQPRASPRAGLDRVQSQRQPARILSRDGKALRRADARHGGPRRAANAVRSGAGAIGLGSPGDERCCPGRGKGITSRYRMSKRKIPQKLLPWLEAKKRHHLSDMHLQMARELGMNPKKLGKLDNHKREPWKLPLPQFIEKLYLKSFKRPRPEKIVSLKGER